ncbi:MAG: hypothetical protein IJK93_00545 [Muribaculaceae bacterium]|nr:hypothetical protein [Muribaculaceae bacterium]
MASTGTKIIALLLSLCACLPLASQVLHEGDLLFCCSDTANAITAVTSGVQGLPIDHVAVVHLMGSDDGSLYVIEAVKPAVCLTPLDSFLTDNPCVLLGRVNVDFDVEASVSRCLSMVGKPYDDLFLPGDSAVYCSELVQMCYVTHEGVLVFETVPMSFHDETGEVTDYWKDFYSSRGMAVPEGLPGTNPGELSRRPQITIIGKYPRHL